MSAGRGANYFCTCICHHITRRQFTSLANHLVEAPKKDNGSVTYRLYVVTEFHSSVEGDAWIVGLQGPRYYELAEERMVLPQLIGCGILEVVLKGIQTDIFFLYLQI